MREKQKLSVTVDADLYRKLQRRSASTEVPVSRIVNRALAAALALDEA